VDLPTYSPRLKFLCKQDFTAFKINLWAFDLSAGEDLNYFIAAK
jgi:hypothetical protein